MRKILSACAVLAMASTVAASSGAAQAAPEMAAAPALVAGPVAPDARLADVHSYTPPKISWGACSDERLKDAGATCGFVKVPLNYSNPKGQKIKIAVSKIDASKKVSYRGAMLVNPGGPGGSGLGLARLGSAVPKNAGMGYDWIGFDPRGVGSSEPSMTCDTKVTQPVRPYYSPTNSTRLRAWVARSKDYASKCGDKNKAMLPHLRSSNTVYDMESIRKALGRTKLNFYGFSYGTYIGQLYATKYPTKVRRFVLDGVVNASQAWYPANLDQNYAFEKTMSVWFDWVAENDATYGLGTDGAEVREKWYALRARLVMKPRPGLGGDEWIETFLSAGYYVYDWDHLAHLFVSADKGDFKPAADEYAAANPSTAGSDNGYAVYLGVQCTDAPWPKDWGVWSKDAWAAHHKAPFLSWSNTWFNAPCKWWPTQSGQRPYMGSTTAPGMLLVAETFDAATPYSGALATRKRFPKSSLIEGKNGTTHSGSLSGIACTDDRIADYLLTGKLPKRTAGNSSDVQCDPVPTPDATTPNAVGRNGVGQSNRWVREYLNEARPN